MNGLLEALLVEVLIPEIADILRKKPESTDADVIAELQDRRARGIAVGRAFLRDTAPVTE